MFLIDTDVLSHLRKRKRNERVVHWLATQRSSDIFISTVTLGEIERGLARKRETDPAFARRLGAWLDRLVTIYGDRILDFDLAAALRWGRLSARIGNSSADLMIAAMALERGLVVVTFNTRHFLPTGVETLDPTQP